MASHPVLDAMAHLDWVWRLGLIKSQPGPFLQELVLGLVIVFVLALILPRSYRLAAEVAGLAASLPDLGTGLWSMGKDISWLHWAPLHGGRYHSAIGPAWMLRHGVAVSIGITVLCAFALVLLTRQRRGRLPPYRVAPHTFSVFPAEILAEKLASTDLCFLDLDGCMVGLPTNLSLARRILLSDLAGATRRLPRPAALKLLAWMALLLLLKGLQMFGFASSGLLVRMYLRALRGIPMQVVQHASETIAWKLRGGVRDFIAGLPRKTHVGILSMAMEPVARQLEKKSGLSFSTANKALTRRWKGEERVWALDRSESILNPRDKQAAATARMERFKSHLPAAVGHDEDDAGMLLAVRERGGLAIGLHPVPELAPFCNVISLARNWKELAGLMRTSC